MNRWKNRNRNLSDRNFLFPCVCNFSTFLSRSIQFYCMDPTYLSCHWLQKAPTATYKKMQRSNINTVYTKRKKKFAHQKAHSGVNETFLRPEFHSWQKMSSRWTEEIFLPSPPHQREWMKERWMMDQISERTHHIFIPLSVSYTSSWAHIWCPGHISDVARGNEQFRLALTCVCGSGWIFCVCVWVRGLP